MELLSSGRAHGYYTWVDEWLSSPPVSHINHIKHKAKEEEGETAESGDEGQRPANNKKHNIR